MTWVKICGTTNLEDALVAIEAGADAVGFVFYKKSPRCVSVETAREIVEKLPEKVEKIGVFVDAESDPVDVVFGAKLTGIQSYVSPQVFADSRAEGGTAIDMQLMPENFRSMIAFPVNLFGSDVSPFQQLISEFARLRATIPKEIAVGRGVLETILLDSGNSQQPGGTGANFDWGKTRPIAESIRSHGLKLVVAGGLKPENVGEAIEALQPWGVDVVSGVEDRPGKKDPEKVRAFVRAVREMDQKVS